MTKSRVSADILKRVVATTAAAAALVSGMALAVAGPASAATADTKHPLVLCAKGDYKAYVVYTSAEVGTASELVDPGVCTKIPSGPGDSFEPIEVRGVTIPKPGTADAPTDFLVADGCYLPSTGGTVTAYGSIQHPRATFPTA